MFDFENQFEESTPMSEYEWDGICEQKVPTSDASEAERKEARLNRWRAERKASHRERILFDAIWYLLIAIGFGVISAWLKDNWQIAAIVLAAVMGMISTYGFGMAHAMRRK